MNVENMIAEKSENVFSSVVASAMEAARQRQLQELGEKCIALISKKDYAVQTAVNNVRSLRKSERELLDYLKNINRAHQYMMETGNPLPLVFILQGKYAVATFCESTGLTIPTTDPTVPADWTPANHDVKS